MSTAKINTGATKKLVGFLMGTKYEDLPAEAVNNAKGTMHNSSGYA